MNRKILLLLGILYPEKKSACYKNGIGSLGNNLNLINPITYLYLFACIVYFGCLRLRYGKNWVEKL